MKIMKKKHNSDIIILQLRQKSNKIRTSNPITDQSYTVYEKRYEQFYCSSIRVRSKRKRKRQLECA